MAKKRNGDLERLNTEAAVTLQRSVDRASLAATHRAVADLIVRLKPSDEQFAWLAKLIVELREEAGPTRLRDAEQRMFTDGMFREDVLPLTKGNEAGIVKELKRWHKLDAIKGALLNVLLRWARLVGDPKSSTAPSKPVVSVEGDHPQIVLDGEAIALDYDVAVWLKSLIGCGDWMSDPEYKAKHGSENDRPDRWRKHLPPEVLAHIETNRRKGSRWRLA